MKNFLMKIQSGLPMPEIVCRMTRFDRKRHRRGDKFRRFAAYAPLPVTR
jgi:hypothetical protein